MTDLYRVASVLLYPSGVAPRSTRRRGSEVTRACPRREGGRTARRDPAWRPWQGALGRRGAMAPCAWMLPGRAGNFTREASEKEAAPAPRCPNRPGSSRRVPEWTWRRPRWRGPGLQVRPRARVWPRTRGAAIISHQSSSRLIVYRGPKRLQMFTRVTVS